MYAATCRPISDPRATSARRRSPEEMCAAQSAASTTCCACLSRHLAATPMVTRALTAAPPLTPRRLGLSSIACRPVSRPAYRYRSRPPPACSYMARMGDCPPRLANAAGHSVIKTRVGLGVWITTTRPEAIMQDAAPINSAARGRAGYWPRRRWPRHGSDVRVPHGRAGMPETRCSDSVRMIIRFRSQAQRNPR